MRTPAPPCIRWGNSSLGAILYELLSDREPFEPKHWEGKSFWEALSQLKEAGPPRPSTRAISDPDISTSAAKRQIEQIEPLPTGKHAARRSGLDRRHGAGKDLERRYRSPADLAAEIGRFLAHEPIGARPPGRAYRIRKYVQRHTAGVLAASVFAELVVAAAVLRGVQLRRVARERDRADRITQFMAGMFKFKVSDPSKARGNSVTATEILD